MTFIVYGFPAPQGSKRHVGRGILIESSKAVKPWRIAVEQAVMLQCPIGGRTDPVLFHGAVAVDVTFSLPRPKSAKAGAKPATARNDLDKLTRSTFDALKTAGVFEDDGHVVNLIARKVYVGHIEPGNMAADGLTLPGAVIRIEAA